jgi:tetratricopeptide (TPR) repeat protein
MNMRKSPALLLSLLLAVAGAASAGYEEGIAAYKAKNYQEAVNQFQGFIEELKGMGAAENPEYAGTYQMLGMSLSGLGKHKEAVEPLKTAVKLNSSDANIQLALGQAYYKANDFRNAADVLGKINTSALPESHRGVVATMLSVSYQKSGQEGLALAQWEKAAKANPDDAATQFNYGAQALAAGYTDNAVAALAKASTLDAKDPAKHRAYAQALLRKGRETPDKTAKLATYGKAATAAQQLTRLENTYDNLLLLGEAQLGAQQYDAAIATFNSANAKNANDWLSHYYLGQAYTAKGSYDQAVTPLKTSLAKPKADQKKIWSQIGFVYEKQKKFDDAKTAYTNAGDSRGLARIEENSKIAQENQAIEEQNKKIQELEEEKKKLEKEMQALPGSTNP